MSSDFINRAKDSFRYRLGKVMPGAVVLLYHRVCPETGDDPQLLTVTSEHFKEHLQVLHDFYSPVKVESLLTGTRVTCLSRGHVGITFDDGYLDNLIHAAPMLEEFEIPAEIYVASGTVNGKVEFYWDVLQKVFRCGSDWNIKIPADTMDRKRYLDECEKIKFMTPVKREQYLAAILSEAKDVQYCPEWRIMNIDELRELAGFKMISIGAHTINHPVLASLTPELQKVEIEGSKNSLESIIGKKVIGFSYPYGNSSSYNQHTIELVRKAGFKYAVANYPDTVWYFTPRYEVPRMLVRNWDGIEFKRRLDSFFQNKK